jgi:hypothetical protein
MTRAHSRLALPVALAASLAACRTHGPAHPAAETPAKPAAPASAATPAPATMAFEIEDFSSCPYPAHNAWTHVLPNGRATRSYMPADFGRDRDSPPPKIDSYKLTLDARDLRDMEDAVRAADYENLHGIDEMYPPYQRGCADCCDRTMTIKSGGKEKKVRYDDVTKPGKLEKLVETYYKIIDRHEWVEDKYPWQK